MNFEIHKNEFSAEERGEQRFKRLLGGNIRGIFEKAKGPERTDAILKKIEPYIQLDPRISRDHMKEELSGIENSEDLGEYKEKVLKILEPFVELRKKFSEEFNAIRRERFFVENPNSQGLNQLLAYEVKGDSIELHILPNETTHPIKMVRLLENGLEKLAVAVHDDPEIKLIFGRSWIVNENPGLITKLGFSIDQSKDYGHAEISRDDFLRRYYKDN